MRQLAIEAGGATEGRLTEGYQLNNMLKNDSPTAISPATGRQHIAGYQPNPGADLHRDGTRSQT